MTFAEVLPHLAAGKKVRRAAWVTTCSVRKSDGLFWCDHCNIEQPPTADAVLSPDWEVVEEPAGCDSCADLRRQLDVQREAEETARRNWASDFVECGKRESEQRKTIARLERELAEAREAKHTGRDVLIAAACWKAGQAGGPFPFEVKCSVIDYMRAGIRGDRLKISLPGTDWLHVFLVPMPGVPEGELA